MNDQPETRYSLWATVGLVLSVMLAGRDDQTKPSTKKGQLDPQDHIDAAYHGLVKTTSFGINQRQVLSEDRVKLPVTAGYGIDHKQLPQYTNARHPIAPAVAANLIHKIESLRQGTGKLTALYKRHGSNNRQIKRPALGFH